MEKISITERQIGTKGDTEPWDFILTERDKIIVWARDIKQIDGHIKANGWKKDMAIWKRVEVIQ